MKQLAVLLFIVICTNVFSQAPQSIPYQAVVRNTDGSVLSNTPLTMTFKIHDVSATGTVVYEESHNISSNAQGLVALNVGGGTPITGTFNTINWGNGAKFLHVIMNTGNGVIDLGTQQMMSVPYALYAEEVNVRVSMTGDSLFIGEISVIIPGVSSANNIYQLGNGVYDIDGNFYPSIIINGQEWMQKNLTVSRYRNGDSIPTGLNDTNWISTSLGAHAVYANEVANDELYGKLYNFYCVIDSRGVCPEGWYVPEYNDWQMLQGFLGGSDIAGGKMKSTQGWLLPNVGASNQSGFSGLPGGMKDHISGYFLGENSIGAWWTSTSIFWDIALVSSLLNSNVEFINANYEKHNGFSIRCIKD